MIWNTLQRHITNCWFRKWKRSWRLCEEARYSISLLNNQRYSQQHNGRKHTFCGRELSKASTRRSCNESLLVGESLFLGNLFVSASNLEKALLLPWYWSAAWLRCQPTVETKQNNKIKWNKHENLEHVGASCEDKTTGVNSIIHVLSSEKEVRMIWQRREELTWKYIENMYNKKENGSYVARVETKCLYIYIFTHTHTKKKCLFCSVFNRT